MQDTPRRRTTSAHAAHVLARLQAVWAELVRRGGLSDQKIKKGTFPRIKKLSFWESPVKICDVAGTPTLHTSYRTRTFLHFCKTASILRTWKLKICLSSSFPFLFQDFNPNCFSSYYYEVFFCTTKSNVGCAMQFQCLKIQNVLHYLLLLLWMYLPSNLFL